MLSSSRIKNIDNLIDEMKIIEEVTFGGTTFQILEVERLYGAVSGNTSMYL